MEDNIKVHPMFSGAAQKVFWANYKIRDLENIISFYGSEFVRLRSAIENDGSTRVIAEALDIPFPRPPYIGDILRNLRGSLDHATSAMFRAVDKRDDRDYFPIGEDAKSFENYVGQLLEKTESEKLSDFFIKKVDARKGGLSENIWYLNQLDRANKHRQLVILEEVVVTTIPDIFGKTTAFLECKFMMSPGQACETTFPPGMVFRDFSYRKTPTIEIKFGPNEILPGKNVIQVLTEFRDTVESVLINLQIEYIEKYPDRAKKFT